MSDPYAAQKKTKTETQQRILGSLEDRPATFTELRARARVSATILAKHLKELQRRGSITQRVEKGDVLYERTDEAKKNEDAAQTIIQIGLQNLKSLPQDKGSLNFLSTMLGLAKEKPEYFEIIMDWLGKMVLLVIGSGRVTWLQGQEGRRALQDEINARNWKPPSAIQSPAELRDALMSFEQVIKDIIMTQSKGVHK